PLILAREGETIQSLRLPRDESLSVIVVFIADGKRRMPGDLKMSRRAYCNPRRGPVSEREVFPSVIDVHVEIRFFGGVQIQDGIVKIPPALVRAILFRPRVVVVEPRELLCGQSRGDSDCFSAVIVLNIVPAVDELETDGEIVIQGLRYASAKVVVRSVCVQIAAAVRPREIVLRELRSGRRIELPEVELKAAPLWRFKAYVRLRNILNDAARGVRRMKHLPGAPPAEIQREAYRVSGMRHGELRHIERKLIRLHFEIAQGVEHARRMIGIEAVVAIDQAAEVDRSYGPDGRRRRVPLPTRLAGRNRQRQDNESGCIFANHRPVELVSLGLISVTASEPAMGPLTGRRPASRALLLCQNASGSLAGQ